jgi:hypothetical protein
LFLKAPAGIRNNGNGRATKDIMRGTSTSLTFDGEEDSGWREEWSATVKATGMKKGWFKMFEKMASYDKDSSGGEEQVKLSQYNNAALYFLSPCHVEKMHFRTWRECERRRFHGMVKPSRQRYIPQCG